MVCKHCGREMYRLDIEGRENWHCPDRLDGKHGEWHSMPVEIVRVPEEEYLQIFDMLHM